MKKKLLKEQIKGFKKRLSKLEKELIGKIKELKAEASETNEATKKLNTLLTAERGANELLETDNKALKAEKERFKSELLVLRQNIQEAEKALNLGAPDNDKGRFDDQLKDDCDFIGKNSGRIKTLGSYGNDWAIAIAGLNKVNDKESEEIVFGCLVEAADSADFSLPSDIGLVCCIQENRAVIYDKANGFIGRYLISDLKRIPAQVK